MDKFLMICYVCADFGPYRGEMFRITPDKIGIFVEAPGWIMDTVMFKWLVRDGSIKVADKQISRKEGENDPMKGMGADGKAVKEEPAEPVEVKQEIIKTRTRKTTKKDDAK